MRMLQHPKWPWRDEENVATSKMAMEEMLKMLQHPKWRWRDDENVATSKIALER